MKVAAAFLADVHLGNHVAHGGPTVIGMNHRCRVGLDTLDAALSSLHPHEVGSLYVLGDLFDTARPPPQLLAETQRVLAKWPGDIWLIKGNHDSNSALPGDHALGPLDGHWGSSVRVVSEPTVDRRGVGMLPFQPEPVLTWFERDARWLKDKGADIVCVHFGLHDAAMRAKNPWMVDCTDAAPVEAIGEILDKVGLHWLYAGNWHSYRNFEPYKCTQVGALMPTGWDNEGEGPFGLVHVSEGEMVPGTYAEIHGPRFLKVRSVVDFNRAVQCATAGNRVYVRVEATAADVPAWLEKCKSCGMFEGYEVLVDRDQVREVAHEAAARARKLDSLGEVAGEYVAGLELPAEVRRGEVLRRTREYLNVAG